MYITTINKIATKNHFNFQLFHKYHVITQPRLRQYESLPLR
jgi:hypothetical protein